MTLNETTKLDDLLRTYPFLLVFLQRRSPKYAVLGNPILRGTVGKVATLGQVAAIGGLDPRQLAAELAAEIAAKAEGMAVGGGNQAKIEALKSIIRDLHRGARPEDVKARFEELVKDVDAAEVARMEQQLIAEGLAPEEVKRLCGVHVQVFQEALDKGEMPHVKPGHPVYVYMLENRAAERILREIEKLSAGVEADDGAETAGRARLTALLDEFALIERHYLRKENQLFPVLEARGMTGPSAVMWAIHDEIRALIKQARRELADDGASAAQDTLRALVQAAKDMIYKEERILFPMSLEALSGEDWEKVRRGEAEIGYAWVEAELGGGQLERGEKPAAARPSEDKDGGAGYINLNTGRLTPEEIDLVLKHLPVDISFINEHDEVAYYSQTKERIFPRSPGVIGRRVHQCHPPKSVHVVQRILDEFKAGRKDVADFQIQMAGRFIHIRYYAVRDDGGGYRGTLEVSQDVTGIRALEGEKRLLDWE